MSSEETLCPGKMNDFSFQAFILKWWCFDILYTSIKNYTSWKIRDLFWPHYDFIRANRALLLMSWCPSAFSHLPLWLHLPILPHTHTHSLAFLYSIPSPPSAFLRHSSGFILPLLLSKLQLLLLIKQEHCAVMWPDVSHGCIAQPSVALVLAGLAQCLPKPPGPTVTLLLPHWTGAFDHGGRILNGMQNTLIPQQQCMLLYREITDLVFSHIKISLQHLLSISFFFVLLIFNLSFFTFMCRQ